MIGYVTLGTNDLERGAAFYDKLTAALGVSRMMENESFIAWGVPGGGAGIGLTKPFNGEAATVGNGVMAQRRRSTCGRAASLRRCDPTASHPRASTWGS